MAKKKVPNPDGSPGKPDHRRTVKRLRARAEDEFPDQRKYEIRENQSIRDSVGEVNRRPDVAVVKRQTKQVEKVYEAARQNKDGTFVSRERKKVDEYNKAGIPSHVEPVK